MEMTSKRLGATAVTGPRDQLLGIITDGDLRRMLEKSVNTADVNAADIMTKTPATISKNALAVEALELLRAKDISQLLVMDGDQYAGFIHIHDLVKEGII
jgi:arabinose-5-phosphate isomerase